MIKVLDRIKIVHYIILLSAFVLLGGCGKKQVESINEDVVQLNVSDVLKLSGVDNTIDAYSAKVNKEFEMDSVEGEIGGGRAWLLSDSAALFMKKHVCDTWEATYDQLVCIDNFGSVKNEKRSNSNQIWDIGKTAIADEYIEINSDSEKGFYVSVKKYNGDTIYEVDLPDLNEENGESLCYASPAIDRDGNIHICSQNYEGRERKYIIFDQNGNVQFEDLMMGEYICGFDVLQDGRVAIVVKSEKINSKKEREERRWLVWNKNGFDEVYHFEWPSLLIDIRFCPYEQGKVIYADKEGIYFSDSSFEKKEIIYRFSNHGIKVNNVAEVSLQGKGIGVIYELSHRFYYLYIEPVEEKREIQQISFAVSSQMKNIYNEAVIEFNRKYPTCNVSLVEYENKNLLITEIISGKGPVLIDTSLTGFQNMSQAWEPLDYVLEEISLLECLDSRVIDLGMIDGKLCGIATNYRIDTVVTNKDYEGWDYKAFVDAIHDNRISYISNSEYSETDREKIVSKFLVHSLTDSYFIDFNKRKTLFSSSKSKQILQCIKEKQPIDTKIEIKDGIREGYVLCNQISISNFKELAAYMLIYGDEMVYTGYPYEDGAHNIISGIAPITVRKNASKEEKELACAFIETLLSYDSQINMIADHNFGFSVRNDVLKEQLEQADFSHGIYVRSLGDVDISKVKKDDVDAIFGNLVKNVRFDNIYSKEMLNVILEEVGNYFNDIISIEDATKNLSNRVGIFLAESE